MATIRTKFRSSSVEGREGTLYFQIIHGRVARQINTGYRLFPSEWDGRMSEIILPVSGDARRSLLLALKERMEKDIRRLESIIAGLERSGGTYPAGRVVELFHNPPPEDSHNFMAFGKRLVEELERVGKKRTAERYTTVLNSFTRFRGRDGDIPLEDIGSTLMLDVTRNFAASLFRNIKYFTLRKLYLCRKWMQKRLQKTTTTGITLPNFDFLA